MVDDFLILSFICYFILRTFDVPVFNEYIQWPNQQPYREPQKIAVALGVAQVIGCEHTDTL